MPYTAPDAYETFCPKTKRFIRDDAKALDRFQRFAVVDDEGIVTWRTNRRVPTPDVLKQWAEMDLPFDRDASLQRRKEQIDETVAKFRAERAALSAAADPDS